MQVKLANREEIQTLEKSSMWKSVQKPYIDEIVIKKQKKQC